MKKYLIPILLVVLLSACTGREDHTGELAPGTGILPVVYVSNYPLQYFAERIASSYFDVRTMAPDGVDPANWRPGIDDISNMQEADLIILNGASFEPWLNSVSLDPSKVVNTTSHIQDQLIPLDFSSTHSHGREGEHQHTGSAYTTWIDPLIAAKQAEVIKSALMEEFPGLADQFESGYSLLLQDLMKIDADAMQALSNVSEIPILFSHPVYQYFARRYNLDTRSLHWEPDDFPSEDQWLKLIDMIEASPSTWMIWEDEPLFETREKLVSMGIQSVVFPTCYKSPLTGDYLTSMKESLEILEIIRSTEQG